MKIKSWTGEEVDARAGMVVKSPTGTRFVISGINDGGLEFYGIDGKHNAGCFKMLHCPFQAGDEFDMVCGDGLCSWKSGGKIKHEFDARIMNAQIPEVFYRHTNPSLRTSEDYNNARN